MRMEPAEEKDVRTDSEVVVQIPGEVSSQFSRLETKKKSRLYNYLCGPYKQHQLLVSCLRELKKYNGVDAEEKSWIFPTATDPANRIGSSFFQLLWYINILVPIVFIILGFVCHDNRWLVCCCAVILSVFISFHSVAIFFILHNQKVSTQLWFINKVALEHYCGRMNTFVEVTLNNIMSVEFLSAGQKSRIVARLARSDNKKGMMMMCTQSFWIRCVQDPLLCLLVLIITSLVALVISVDLMRRHHM